MADRISQEVIEVALESPSTTRLTQVVIEVILCPLPAIVGSCPSTNTLTVGVPFFGTLAAASGNGTYAFTVIS